jgi:hypothetical protein
MEAVGSVALTLEVRPVTGRRGFEVEPARLAIDNMNDAWSVCAQSRSAASCSGP